MFNIFKEKTPEDLARSKMKRLRKSILKEGGPARVCYRYWKFLENHELYQELGIVVEEEAPYPKSEAILSALDLLNSWKTMSDDDPTIKELSEKLSRVVYVGALLSSDIEERSKLLSDAGGVPGRITVDIADVSEIGETVRTQIADKTIELEAAWLRWKETDFDVFDAIKNT